MALCRIGGSIGLRAKQVTDESAQRELADDATERRLTHAQAKSAVKQHKGKPAPKSRGFKQSFFAENGIKVTVSTSKKVKFNDVEMALAQAIEEVRHYIEQDRKVF
jgi:hypothetical protein